MNGISGDPYWVGMAWKKLNDKFKESLKGIFNRSDGLLSDILECAGESNANAYENDIIQVF